VIISKINDKISQKLAVATSSMWLFWILCLIMLVAMFMHTPTDTYEWTLFGISAAFQALALPVLAFVTGVQRQRREKAINKTHRLVIEELALIRKQQTELKKLISFEEDHFKRVTLEIADLGDKVEEIDKQTLL
jgi:hypothetical protein